MVNLVSIDIDSPNVISSYLEQTSNNIFTIYYGFFIISLEKITFFVI